MAQMLGAGMNFGGAAPYSGSAPAPPTGNASSRRSSNLTGSHGNSYTPPPSGAVPMPYGRQMPLDTQVIGANISPLTVPYGAGLQGGVMAAPAVPGQRARMPTGLASYPAAVPSRLSPNPVPPQATGYGAYRAHQYQADVTNDRPSSDTMSPVTATEDAPEDEVDETEEEIAYLQKQLEIMKAEQRLAELKLKRQKKRNGGAASPATHAGSGGGAGGGGGGGVFVGGNDGSA
jgi:hypothetical protein